MDAMEYEILPEVGIGGVQAEVGTGFRLGGMYPQVRPS